MFSLVVTTNYEKGTKLDSIFFDKIVKQKRINCFKLKCPQFFVVCVTFLAFLSKGQCFCGDSIKWSHNVNIDDVYGMWYGVGYAQHTPDMTNKPNEVGCVTLFIADASTEFHDDWLDWSIQKRNYSDENWRSHKSLPWSDISIAGSWLNVRIKRNASKDINERNETKHSYMSNSNFNKEGLKTSILKDNRDNNLNNEATFRQAIITKNYEGTKTKKAKKEMINEYANRNTNSESSERDVNIEEFKKNPDKRRNKNINESKSKDKRRSKRNIYNERRVKIIWDEDGQSLEQTYVYSPEAPGLWVADKRPMLEREMKARGIEIWYPDDPPRHPQVIRILKATPHSLTINHCSDLGGGGIFSLILQRSPSTIKYWEWYNIKRQLFNFDLPNIHRYTTICAGCVGRSSMAVFFTCLMIVVVRFWI